MTATQATATQPARTQPATPRATQPSTTTAARPAGRILGTETVAVLGAGGTMGLPIARNIARAGLQVRAWNRSADKAKPLADDGAYLARTPREAATGAGIVITMLADADAVIGAMDGPDGALAAMRGAHPRGAHPGEHGPGEHSPGEHSPGEHGPGNAGARHVLWVQMSTIGEEATRRCAELADRSGVGFMDAPVLGTRQPAEEGKLVVLESGPEEAGPRVQPVFDAIGQHTIRAGEAGAGSRLKRAASSCLLAVVEGAAETTATSQDSGLNLPLIDAIARRFAEPPGLPG